ncbi:hypothetical protein [Diaminobutyricimonas sp. TR449]|uniref:hypothetical protein n=1 Tax=Diaminobutyricimonas sp. TR449 TaxID=2708076 RepID=UPI0014212D2A|nr:hypothetical protein [Diaminobutyricimonas sp. TR449]
MSDELTVQVGYRVSTEEQARHEAAMVGLQPALQSALRRLTLIEGLGGDCHVDQARSALLAALAGIRLAQAALASSAASYAATEAILGALLGQTTAAVGYATGFVGPAALLLIGPLLAAFGPVIRPLLVPEQQLDPESRAAREQLLAALFSHPMTVELVRAVVMGSDDLVGGLLKVPPSVVTTLGDQGIGLTGPHTIAALIAGSAGFLMLARETPVTVERTARTTVSPPHGARERLSRIPQGGGSQVRVERYPLPAGAACVEVYIGGTVAPAFSGDEPWDMTSNLHGAASLDPASLRAVELALDEAGVQPGDSIGITGYSQGALIGALLASSGEYRVDFLLEAGGPTGQVPIPDDVTHVRLDHTADLVTALGGDVRGEHTVQVRRDGLPETSDELLPAHDLAYYRETAALVDASVEPRLVAALAAADGRLAAAADGTATSWRATRISGAS